MESAPHICELEERVKVPVTDPFSVSNVYVGPTGRTIILVVTRMPWQNALQSLTVDFGKCSSNYEVRRHPDLRKRQSVESSTSDASATSTTISFPVPPSSSPTPSVHEAHGDIGKQFLDQSILPPSLAGTDGITLHGPLMCAYLVRAPT